MGDESLPIDILVFVKLIIVLPIIELYRYSWVGPTEREASQRNPTERWQECRLELSLIERRLLVVGVGIHYWLFQRLKFSICLMISLMTAWGSDPVTLILLTWLLFWLVVVLVLFAHHDVGTNPLTHACCWSLISFSRLRGWLTCLFMHE